MPSFARGLIFLEFIPPRCVVYRTICEQLEATDRIADATEWFYGESFSTQFSTGIQPFLSDFMQWRLSAPNRNVDAVLVIRPTPLLRE